MIFAAIFLPTVLCALNLTRNEILLIFCKYAYAFGIFWTSKSFDCLVLLSIYSASSLCTRYFFNKYNQSLKRVLRPISSLSILFVLSITIAIHYYACKFSLSYKIPFAFLSGIFNAIAAYNHVWCLGFNIFYMKMAYSTILVNILTGVSKFYAEYDYFLFLVNQVVLPEFIINLLVVNQVGNQVYPVINGNFWA
jgi:hypothetical protein